ncbi:MAG: Lrp/AsnC family transcriptional regulator [Chloroflexi bacterium]|nr:Lrp/AsnC family transcriptional regulator [Chloroflexota bacterium]
MNLDSIDRKLVSLVQAEFPLVEEPYANLGKQLGINGDEVIRRLASLKAEGLIRQIGPVLDARSLGYQSTLVAMSVKRENLESAEEIIAKHPAVSHGYEREHYFNIWITFAAPPGADMQTELKKLTSNIQTEAVVSLPATKLYKINAHFDMDGETNHAGTGQKGGSLNPEVKLSRTDRLLINEMQQDLPLTPSPFDEIARQAGMSVKDFLNGCQSLLQRGVLRRYGAAVNHRRAGFNANAMTCWVVPPDAADAIGKKLASLREVSHCYERLTGPLWRHNLFAMIHGRTKEACEEIVNRVSEETGLSDRMMLLSTKEFKKTRIKYNV